MANYEQAKRYGQCPRDVMVMDGWTVMIHLLQSLLLPITFVMQYWFHSRYQMRGGERERERGKTINLHKWEGNTEQIVVVSNIQFIIFFNVLKYMHKN